MVDLWASAVSFVFHVSMPWTSRYMVSWLAGPVGKDTHMHAFMFMFQRLAPCTYLQSESHCILCLMEHHRERVPLLLNYPANILVHGMLDHTVVQQQSLTAGKDSRQQPRSGQVTLNPGNAAPATR